MEQLIGNTGTEDEPERGTEGMKEGDEDIMTDTEIVVGTEAALMVPADLAVTTVTDMMILHPAIDELTRRRLCEFRGTVNGVVWTGKGTENTITDRT